MYNHLHLVVEHTVIWNPKKYYFYKYKRRDKNKQQIKKPTIISYENFFLLEYDIKKMVKLFLRFAGDEIEKKKYHSSKNPIELGDIDNNKIIISDTSAYDKNLKN